MLKLLVTKIIEFIEVSSGKVKVFWSRPSECTHSTCENPIFAIFAALIFIDLVFTRLDLADIRSLFDN